MIEEPWIEATIYVHRLEIEQVAEAGEVALAGEAFGLAAVADDGQG